MIVEHDVLCVSAEDEVHTKVNVWTPVLIITRITAVYKLQLVDVPLSGFFIQNSAQIPRIKTLCCSRSHTILKL